ncbi:hypothetical protein BBP40_011472 [Aspergillus hancockii]|nr:hypothetical protein BBP40_011472 [Aspergillus hancockii]
MSRHKHDSETGTRQHTGNQTSPEKPPTAATSQGEVSMDTSSHAGQRDGEYERPITVYSNATSFPQDSGEHNEFIGFGFDPCS